MGIDVAANRMEVSCSRGARSVLPNTVVVSSASSRITCQDGLPVAGEPRTLFRCAHTEHWVYNHVSGCAADQRQMEVIQLSAG